MRSTRRARCMRRPNTGLESRPLTAARKAPRRMRLRTAQGLPGDSRLPGQSKDFANACRASPWLAGTGTNFVTCPDIENRVACVPFRDGTVNWGFSSMVEHLREAETLLAVDGWTPLAGTMERMQALHPEYTLERYRCSSWRQLLNDCGQFEQRCVEGVSSKDSRTWFRSRTGKAAGPR